MASATQETQHSAKALARFTEQWKNKPVVNGIVKAVCGPVQTLENAVFDVIVNRLLANAVGVQLDSLGALVGEARENRIDADYKPAITIRIRVNRSQGKAEDILQVMTLAMQGAPFLYHETEVDNPAAAFEVVISNVAASLVRALVRLLGETRSAGTRGVLVSTTIPDAQTHIWDNSAGPSLATATVWADSNGSTININFANHQEVNP